MIVYRLTKTRYLYTAWSGQGAKEAGGRWNSIGMAMIYASGTASLSMLETLVHLHAANLLDSYTLLSVDIAEAQIQTIDESQLPSDWGASKAPSELASIGDQWLSSGTSVALRVPSALSPVEYNFLLNPTHPAFQKMVNDAVHINFKFDERLK